MRPRSAGSIRNRAGRYAGSQSNLLFRQTQIVPTQGNVVASAALDVQKDLCDRRKPVSKQQCSGHVSKKHDWLLRGDISRIEAGHLEPRDVVEDQCGALVRLLGANLNILKREAVDMPAIQAQRG